MVAGAATTAAAGLAACGTETSAAPSVSGGDGTEGLTLIYPRNAGSSTDGLVVFSWVEVKPDQWSAALASWTQHRENLYAKYGVPPTEELHASALIAGRGSPSENDTFNESQSMRRALVEDSLGALGENDSIEIGTVYRRTPERGRAYQTVKADTFSDLVSSWDDKFSREGRFPMISITGLAITVDHALKAHRLLNEDTKKVRGNPYHHDGPISQWTQMADLLAWAAYQGQRPNQSNDYAWDWYEQKITASKPNALVQEF